MVFSSFAPARICTVYSRRTWCSAWCCTALMQATTKPERCLACACAVARALRRGRCGACAVAWARRAASLRRDRVTPVSRHNLAPVQQLADISLDHRALDPRRPRPKVSPAARRGPAAAAAARCCTTCCAGTRNCCCFSQTGQPFISFRTDYRVFSVICCWKSARLQRSLLH